MCSFGDEDVERDGVRYEDEVSDVVRYVIMESDLGDNK